MLCNFFKITDLVLEQEYQPKIVYKPFLFYSLRVAGGEGMVGREELCQKAKLIWLLHKVLNKFILTHNSVKACLWKSKVIF